MSRDRVEECQRKGPPSRFRRPFYKSPHTTGVFNPTTGFKLPIGHFLGHVEQELAIFFVGLAQQATKLVEIARFLTGAAPSDIVRRSALRKVRQLRRLFAVVEELIERALESARQFLQRFDGWDSVAIFNARDVAAEKSGTLLDITL